MILKFLLGVGAAAVFPAPVLGQSAPTTATSVPTTLALSAPATGPARLEPPDLLAHGSSDRFWVARLASQPSGRRGVESTTIFVRQRGDSSWRRMSELGTRISAMAHRGSELDVLLPNGDWMIVSEDGGSTGRPLPGYAPIAALGGDGETLWAVGVVKPAATSRPGGKPTTAPTSATGAGPTSPSNGSAGDPARASTGPTLSAAPSPRLVLFRLQRGEWTAVADLPDRIDPKAALSLGIQDGTPFVAVIEGPRVVRVYGLRDGKWSLASTYNRPDEIRDVEIVGGLAGPAVWIVGDAGSSLQYRGPQGARSLDYPPRSSSRGAALANGMIRVVWFEGDTLGGESFDPATGKKSGESGPATLPSLPLDPAFRLWGQAIVMGALAFAILATIRRRREMQEMSYDPAKAPLAPLPRRLVAGIIDAVPVVVTMAVLYARQKLGYGTASPEAGAIAFAASLAVYVAHTLVFELLTGRSPGKMVTGLKVVGLDGGRAKPSSIVIRNLLRVIDFALAFFPLVLVIYSPLRQRAGDVAAGTLVVLNEAPAETESEKELVGSESSDR